jgi:hypothetical protein
VLRGEVVKHTICERGMNECDVMKYFENIQDRKYKQVY